MIPKELDDLIKEYLTDGVISPAERKVLLRKAEKMGLDLDEIDLYITAQEQKVDNKTVAENKAAIGKICPQCGRQVESMTVRCECGYEFKNEKTVSSVQKLYEDLNNIQFNKAEIASCTRDREVDNKKLEKLRHQKKCDLISTFPIPNNKEDIIEFLALAAPQFKKTGSFWWGTMIGRIISLICFLVCACIIVSMCIYLYDPYEDRLGAYIAGTCGCMVFYGGLFGSMIVGKADTDSINRYKEASVWREKFDQALMKGRSLRGDAEFQQQLDYYENLMKK